MQSRFFINFSKQIINDSGIEPIQVNLSLKMSNNSIFLLN